MKYCFIPLFCMILAASSVQAQTDADMLQPKVQQILVDSQEKTIVPPEAYSLKVAEGSCRHAVESLQQILPGCQAKSRFQIILGKKGDKSVKKYVQKIPKEKEGYYLEIQKDRIVIAGADQRGAFYGVQTLAQMLKQGSLSICSIQDYPDVRFRGVVEGFYGTPWSHEERMRQLEFYGRNKMNTYIYGPKDDPYHSSPNWRKPYPEKEAGQLRELVEQAARNEVDFVWAIHPGKDIKWTDEDRDALLNKFESMYTLGVRSFAVFFDDIWGEGTNPNKQAELLNYIDSQFIQKKHDVAPLIMCPTEYNRSWSNVEGGYLTTLGEKLNRDIQIMWTGNSVIATIDKETMNWINPLIRRKAYIWWNFPVNDYVRDHMLLGPTYGNSKDIKDDVAGFVSNPMEHAEASKISLYSIADYSWNMESYDSMQSWRNAIKDILPQKARYMEIFASHSSDTGPNGHGFRREESKELQPMLKALETNPSDSKAQACVSDECIRLETACDVLLADTENPELINEIRPWLKQGKLLGEYGQSVLLMLKSAQRNDSAFMLHYDRAHALQALMYELDMTENQNPYQPGVKIGSLHLLPTLNKLYTQTVSAYNSKYNCNLDAKAEYNPYKLTCDVPQLKQQPIHARRNEINVSPSNEVIKWPAKASMMISTEQPIRMNMLIMDFGTKDISGKFSAEISYDGKAWTPMALAQPDNKTEIQGTATTVPAIKYIRIVNTSDKELEIYLKRFTIKIER